MIRCNLKTVRNYVRNHDEFKCNNSLSGEWADKVKFGWIDGGDTGVSLANHLLGACKNYVVYSYDTPIAVYNHKGWWIGKEGHSVTTKRHISAIGLK